LYTPRTYQNSPEACAIANGSSPMPGANSKIPSTNPSPNEKSLNLLKYPKEFGPLKFGSILVLNC